MHKLDTQQSHHCGIETQGLQIVGYTLTSSNRTIVGLKLESHNSSLSRYVSRSNRTIVGLKPLLADKAALRIVKQQSHHCGIETWRGLSLAVIADRQQSHHCGIETRS